MKWQHARDIALFLGGMGGVVHETVLSHSERPTLLILFAAMMGLPAFLSSEVKPRWNDKKPDGSDEHPNDHEETKRQRLERKRELERRRKWDKEHDYPER